VIYKKREPREETLLRRNDQQRNRIWRDAARSRIVRMFLRYCGSSANEFQISGPKNSRADSPSCCFRRVIVGADIFDFLARTTRLPPWASQSTSRHDSASKVPRNPSQSILRMAASAGSSAVPVIRSARVKPPPSDSVSSGSSSEQTALRR
jgi:hypothetical protein